jgi:Flp pilus assembly protein CpaB
MKKYIPLLVAAVVFILAILLLQPESKVPVVVLTNDLPAGHVLTEIDLAMRELPESFRPVDAIESPAEAVGQTIKTDRSKGDILRQRHLGEPVTLQADERAVAIRVDDATGLGGLLAPGDTVGITAVIFGNNVAFSKVTMEGFRVLYVSPEFRAGFEAQQYMDGSDSSSTFAQERSEQGTVVLAVPIQLIDVRYDFSFMGGTVEVRKVNAVEMIAALTASGNSKIVLYKMPANPETMQSPGLYLPDLVLIPTPSVAPTSTGTAPDGTVVAP